MKAGDPGWIIRASVERGRARVTTGKLPCPLRHKLPRRTGCVLFTRPSVWVHLKAACRHIADWYVGLVRC